MDRTQRRSNVTVQGVGSPVPASDRGERAGPGTSIYSDCNRNEKDNVNPSLGVAHLAPNESITTSKGPEGTPDPFMRIPKIPRTPPRGGRLTEKEAEPVIVTSIASETPTEETLAESDEDIISKEVKKCMKVLKTMRLACEKQKNISKDIKNGIDVIEESIDIMNWLHKKNKKVCPTTTKDESSKVKTEDVGTQTHEDVDKQTYSTKRPPSSPLTKTQGKRTRKSSTGGRHHVATAGEEQTQKAPASDSQKSGRTADSDEKQSYAKIAEAAETMQEKDPQKSNEKTVDKGTKRRKEKTKRKRRRKLKPEAILIRPNGGKSFSDILREIRQKVNPEDTETTVKTVRKTKAGDVLLELGPKAKNRPIFEKAIQNILGDSAKVRNLEPKTTLEIRDLDELTTEEEVQEAIKKEMGNQPADIKIFVTGKNRNSLKMALIYTNESTARELLKKPVLRIGWSQCRVRRRIEVTKCFRCLGYGHLQANCSGPDRRGQKMCFNCGNTDHKRKDCNKPPKCFLCASLEGQPCTLDHVAGSGKCQVFKKALEDAKTASSK